MPATAGSTTFSRRKQKMGFRPSRTQTKLDALKPLKYSRISQFTPAPGRQIRRQIDRPVSQPHQPAHRMAQGLEEAPDFAVAAFLQHHPIPAVAALAFAVVFDALEPRRLAVDLDAGK